MQAIVIDSNPRAELGERLEHIERRLGRELGPSQREFVRELRMLLDEEAGDKADDYGDAIVNGIARHFPGLAPAIRAVAMHQIDEPDLCAETCRPEASALTVVR